ncbi:MAG: Gfo/Idh/MocA family protein [Phycisphaerales bacterium]
MSDRRPAAPAPSDSESCSSVSRRTVLRGSVAAAGLPIIGAGLGTMSSAASWQRIRGANDRLSIGVIGTGGMGTGHVRDLVSRSQAENVRVTRVCDVYQRRLDHAAGLAAQQDDVLASAGDASTLGTMEYREVLDDPSVDAVLIATPDHWHVKIAIEAMDAGKDVYVEKPLSHTIEQALACRDAVKRTGRVLQVGPQGTSDGRMWAAREAIERGAIGKVTWSQGAYCRNSRGGQFNWRIDPDATPKAARGSAGHVWWDRWLGWEHELAERIPWNADHFFRFRKYFAYNGGLATDLLYHRLAPLLMAISGHSGEYPKRVVASGGRYLEKDERDIPDTFMMVADYPSEHSVMLVSVMTNDVGLPLMIRGQHATMDIEPTFRLREQGVWAPEFRANNADALSRANVGGGDVSSINPGQAEFPMQGVARRDQKDNWFDAIRNGDRLACDVDLGCSTMVAIKMAVEAYRQNKVMQWDAEAERMVAS